MCKFTHLHVHTDASQRDGLGTVDRLVSHAASLGYDKLAMTDHGTLGNAISFGITAMRHGIKPIYGLEGYIYFDGSIGHITLLADGMKGWKQLLALNNISHRSEFKQPAFTVDELIKHADGLVCLTGCIASPFHQLSSEEAYKLGLILKGVFGHGLFAEMMFIGDSNAWERTEYLASRLNIKKVMTNDVHFPFRSDGQIHSILTRMKSGFEYTSDELFLKSPEEMIESATAWDYDEDEIKLMMKRADWIASRLGAIDLSSEPKLPKIDTLEDDFWTSVMDSERSKGADKEYYERFEYERKIISEMGYVDYFIILNDILDNARCSGVKIGPGRGSGAGSLVLYWMGVTDVDPIKYGLQFERFLNPHRRGMPDVDVDIESERRDLVLDYANETYGAIPIATYSRYSHKSLTRDLGKMFRIDSELIGAASDGGPNSDAFLQILEDDESGQFEECYEAFMGQIRHKGKHAGGVIITDTAVPEERMGKTIGAAWSEGGKNELSHAGIVKFDLLGLSVLSALRRLEEECGFKPEEPLDGSVVFDVFKSGDLAGIFQFSGSDGIRRLTMKLQPNKFEDLVAINALYRPGAIDAGSTEMYPEWKKSPRVVPEYIEDILASTYGAIVFQEQFMAIYAKTVDGSLAEADEARRVITKSKPDDPSWVEKRDSMRANFIACAKDIHGLSPTKARELWGELETHSRYSFNKSHSAAYAMLSWQCAWWKYNYPAKFYAAMLNTDPAEEQTYVFSALKSGIKIGPPSVNESLAEWSASDDKRLAMPLSSIKFMGSTGVDCIIEERKVGGKFESLENFMERCPKKLVRARAREGLWRLGGFGSLVEGLDREEIRKTLALKSEAVPMGRQQRQLKYLGFIVPNAKMLAEYNRLGKRGFTCGIIKSIDHRESKHGPYTVFRLSPNGVFWTRDKTAKTLEKGLSVAAKISDKNGRLIHVKKL